MGGFGGGHSGGGFHGGGFHGGHSSGGFHLSGGFRPHHHTTFIYVGGRRYETRGNNNNSGYKKPSIVSSIIIAVAILFIGFIIFFGNYHKPYQAIITSTDRAYDVFEREYYEVYTFDYNVNGITYHGKGDDDLGPNGEFTINLGEKYTIYARVFEPSSYSFENNNGIAFFLLFVSIAISGVIVISTFSNLKNYKKRLESIGDLNGDGKLDEKDIEIYLSRKNGFDKTEEKREEKKDKECPYCGSLIDINEKFCPNCGANLNY